MDIKTQVIQEYLETGAGYRKLAAKYGVCRTTINKWVMIHRGFTIFPVGGKARKTKHQTKSMTMTTYKSFTGLILIFLLLTACNSVTVELNGVLCYPSEYIPKMTVYLKNKSSDKVYKLTTTENQRLFKFTNIPFGDYVAYAYTIEQTQADTAGIESKASGGYTKAVPCGLTINCNDHSLIAIKINSKITKDTISICDWYGAVVPTEE